MTSTVLADTWLDALRQDVANQGFAYRPHWVHPPYLERALLDLGRYLGELYPLQGQPPERPLLRTRPEAGAPAVRPFDRPECLGWHNDMVTHRQRPRLTLIAIEAQDPAGVGAGDWKVATVSEVVAALRQLPEAADVLGWLRQPQPFGYEGDGRSQVLPVLETAAQEDDWRLRFYGRALRDGSRLSFGSVPPTTLQAVDAVERAAESVKRTLRAQTGALLVLDNERSLHDRTPQTAPTPTSKEQARRRAVLCFVKDCQGLEWEGWSQ